MPTNGFHLFFPNRLNLVFLSPMRQATTKKKSARAKKYIYCSSYSSKTTELNFSASIFLMSSIIGFSPNSVLHMPRSRPMRFP